MGATATAIEVLASTTETTSTEATTTPTTTPLQLRWMYENALNLQASCPRRGSVCRCDGEDISLSHLLYEKKNLRRRSSFLTMRAESYPPQSQPQGQQQRNINISSHSIAAQ